MSRSGYSDDGDSEIPIQLYRQAVRRATRGYHGQHLLKRLRDALDAMPVKRLIAGNIRDESGQVCVLGALDSNAPKYNEDEYDDYEHPRKLAEHFKIAPALASEIVYMNDEAYSWRGDETPEARWTRMRAWVEKQILAPQIDVEPPSGAPEDGRT